MGKLNFKDDDLVRVLINDRVLNGAIAGTVGATVQNIYAVIGRAFHWPEFTYADYGQAVLFLGVEKGVLAFVLGLAAHYIWDIILGVIFGYFIENMTSRYLYLKGILYGAVVWYFIKVVAVLYRIPVIGDASPETVSFFFCGGIMYGLVIAYILNISEGKNMAH